MATIGFSIFVALQVALLARSVMRDDRGLIIVATVGLTVAAVVVSLFVWMRPQWVRLNRLRAMFPEATVFGAQSYSGLGYVIGDVIGLGKDANGPLLGTYFIVVVDSDGIGFWKGRGTPRRKHLLPWTLVTGVSTNTLALARELPAIDVAVSSATVESQHVSFCPCREGWRVGFALLDRGDVGLWTERVRTSFDASRGTGPVGAQ